VSQFLDAALAYQRAGLHPIPVEPRGKRPILASWREFVERRPTVEEIERWWTATPDANVALLMGRGMFALDIDGPEGEAALASAGITLPYEAPQVWTGKGRHIFLRGQVSNSVGVLAKVDTRSDGGYVVAPPSIHPSGGIYRWDGLDLTTALVPSAPDALMELLARPTRPGAAAAAPGAPSAADWVSIAMLGVGEGQRDVTCTRLAGYFWGKGVPAEATEVILQAWADRCTPPFPAAQVTKCVDSIVRREGGPQDALAGPPITLDAAIDEFLAEIELPLSERRLRPTGLQHLDHLTSGGFAPGELILLGARPGVGKTALACQWGRRNAKAGAGVLFVSREMTRVALVRRLLVQESGVRASALKTGELDEIERDMLNAAIERLRYLPFKISSSIRTIEELETAVAAYETRRLGLVVVDYLQLMRGGDFKDKRGTVEFVSAGLKDIALRYEVPMLVLSSLRRLAKRKDGSTEPPDMSDLRESGELEHDGDLVLIMTREFNADTADLIVAKNRDGRVGRVKLTFKGELMHFEEA
jgi:hypothetical protein